MDISKTAIGKCLHRLGDILKDYTVSYSTKILKSNYARYCT